MVDPDDITRGANETPANQGADTIAPIPPLGPDNVLRTHEQTNLPYVSLLPNQEQISSLAAETLKAKGIDPQASHDFLLRELTYRFRGAIQEILPAVMGQADLQGRRKQVEEQLRQQEISSAVRRTLDYILQQGGEAVWDRWLQMLADTVAHPQFIVPDSIRLIGKGGMGAVYEVTIAATGERLAFKLIRDVTIKLLLRALSEARQYLVLGWLIDEVVAGRALYRTAEIPGLQESNGYLVIAMELVEGQTFAQFAEQLPKDENKFLRLIEQLLPSFKAMDQVHNHFGIVHRDLKGANTMVTPEGNIQQLDFGLARTRAGLPSIPEPIGIHIEYNRGNVEDVRDQAHDSRSGSPTSVSETQDGVFAGITRASISVGTPAFMSLDQIRGTHNDTPEDVWNLFMQLVSGLIKMEATRMEDWLIAYHTEAISNPDTDYWVDLIVSLVDDQYPDKTPQLDPLIRAILKRGFASQRERRLTMAESARYLETYLAVSSPLGDQLERLDSLLEKEQEALRSGPNEISMRYRVSDQLYQQACEQFVKGAPSISNLQVLDSRLEELTRMRLSRTSQ